MLYLVKPDRSLSYVDMPARLVLDVAAEHIRDLSGLEWLPADRGADEAVVALALRRGHVCAAGLMVDGADVYVLRHPAHLQETHDAAAASREAIRPHDAVMEEVGFTGWVAHRRDQDAIIDHSFEQVVKRAQADADALLAADIDPVLERHWAALGGVAPQP